MKDWCFTTSLSILWVLLIFKGPRCIIVEEESKWKEGNNQSQWNDAQGPSHNYANDIGPICKFEMVLVSDIFWYQCLFWFLMTKSWHKGLDIV